MSTLRGTLHYIWVHLSPYIWVLFTHYGIEHSKMWNSAGLNLLFVHQI